MPEPYSYSDEPAELSTLRRKPTRGGDRALLDEVLDSVLVGTLSTVVDGWPWSVPLLFARDGDDILMHGSVAAGALRHAAEGAPSAFTVFVLDAIVVADSLFDHSANYRSAVVRGIPERADDDLAALEALSDKLIPGRVAETPSITGKERAATVALRMPIVDGQWIAKARSGGPGVDTDNWTGVVPVRTVYDDPIPATGIEIPESVRRLASGGRRRR
ncbi:pyridoxamine 5'-phosphate oxidase family protein [Gordonia polyisoprenivorans]|uniref:pyridoxamine 5'-phosphate oxidase family protein n=1 Tax=Gordonia polyisoprenivorans TaxID=84595 RepID=UPI000B99E3B6|nr:pyridoxamine 5'-phosphate oxidase family protein [Gordonia polyisoprenivorans]OZC33238.1 pyridoxamine 5'-phosphate oxidase [Gordonia polyisoprenivorans]